MRRLLVVALLLSACRTIEPPPMIEGPQGSLHVNDGGKGDLVPVLFVHGNGGNLAQWGAQLAHLRKTRRAVAFDLRGMGLSQPPADGIYTIEAMTQDIEAVVTALGLHRFVIVGHSYGGAVVAAYAAEHPDRVVGVVYADSAGDLVGTEEQFQNYLNALRVDKPGVIRKAYEGILAPSSDQVKAAVLFSADRVSVEAYTEAMEGLREFSVAKAVRAYKGPKVAIVADAPPNPYLFHVQFPEVPMRAIEGVGHWLMMDKPEEFNRVLDEMLARVK